MKKIIIGAVLLVFVVLVSFMGSPKKQSKLSGELSSPQVEENETRVYKANLKLINKLEFLEGNGIFRMYSDGENIWTIDNTQEVNKISSLGERIETRLVKAGGAPFENSQLSSVKREGSRLSMVDIERNTIRIQEGKDNLLEYQKLYIPIYNGVGLTGKRFLTISDYGPSSSFQLFDITKTEALWEKELTDVFQLEESEFPEIVTEGIFTYNQSKKTFYVPGRFGKFICFDDEGKILYTGETVDKTPAPKVFTKQIMKGMSAQMFVREPDFYVNYSCSADDNHLYILSKHKTNKRDNFRTIDAYNVNEGSYAFSFPVPNMGEQLPIEIALLEENKIFVLYENYDAAYFQIEPQT